MQDVENSLSLLKDVETNENIETISNETSGDDLQPPSESPGLSEDVESN